MMTSARAFSVRRGGAGHCCALQVSLQEFTFGGGTQARNVVARLPGTGSGAEEIVVVGGHFDSLPGGALAPSAVDNGSGTIGMIELAQIFAQFTFNRTIEFVAFGALTPPLPSVSEQVWD
jgi:Zn-dependent M28 family amino/carboxypeptidase